MREILNSDFIIRETYDAVRNSIINAQNKVYNAVNAAMVQAYWEIGEQIYKACGENERAEYGKGLIKYIAENLSREFGKGFDERNLRKMRQFYMAYPIRIKLSFFRQGPPLCQCFRCGSKIAFEKVPACLVYWDVRCKIIMQSYYKKVKCGKI